MAAESIDELIRRAERRTGRPLSALYADVVQGYVLRAAGLRVPREELADVHHVWVAAFGPRDAVPTLRYGATPADALGRAAARPPRRRPRPPRSDGFTR